MTFSFNFDDVLRTRALRAAMAGLALAIFFAAPSPATAASVDVEAKALPLNPEDPAAQSVDQLVYRGGLHLLSTNERFGGFSGLGVSADGRRMVSVSDAGFSFSANLIYDADGNLAGVENTTLAPLADLDGTSLAGKFFSDAEAMSPGVEGEIIVAFERDHRLWRYDPGATTPRVLRPPEELTAMGQNDGIEALTLLNDGRLLAISEGSPREPSTIGWVSRRGGWDVLTYITEDGFRATGAATTADGTVLVVERNFTPRQGVRIRIKAVDPRDIGPGVEVRGELLATLRPPVTVDNLEGIEALVGPNGETLVYLISDDNFNDTQRTLLLMFELKRDR